MKNLQRKIDFILQNEHEDVNQLALKLNNEKENDCDNLFILRQIKGRQIAKNKLPTWYAHLEIVYPSHLSLEQASSEVTARYKTSLIGNEVQSFADLTGGMGVDFSFLATRFEKSIYVEQNKELCETAVYNFNLLGIKKFFVENSSSETFLSKTDAVDVIYLDPSRRDQSGRKVVRIEDCSPNVAEIQDLLFKKSKLVLVKFSPMLDIALAVKNLKNINEIHVVSVDNECKELLFLLSGTPKLTKYVAVNLNKITGIQKYCFTPEEEQNSAVSFAETVRKYLYEPNSSILKAGAFRSVACKFSVQKLHVNSHLYTSDKLVLDFPGRIFEVQNRFTPNKKNIKTFVSNTKKANIVVRNFPMSVAEIRQKTGLKEGGEIYLFATTLMDNEKIWIIGDKIDICRE